MGKSKTRPHEIHLRLDEEEYQALEMMANKGIIVLNRQMVPFSIRKAVEIETVIDRLYSELC